MRRQQGRLREDRGLSISRLEERRIRDLAVEAGFPKAGFARDCAGIDGVEADSSILVCCFSCKRQEPDDLSTPDDPHGLIAPFARRNYYKTAARMLSRLAVRLEGELGIPHKSMRVFSNSRLPEKRLCLSAGLAWPGKNGLCISPGLGSLFVIAGLVIPRALDGEPDRAEPVPSRCGSCRRCMDACPAGAIVSPGVVDVARCLQGFAARPDALPAEVMARWGARLYGCQDCQSVCPHNVGVTTGNHPVLGEIGPSVSLRWFLAQDGAGLGSLFHGTAMGMSWISKDALVRNALVAAGNSGSAGLASSVAPFVGSSSPAISAAAAWALGRISGKGAPGVGKS